ncbi:MAG: pilin [Betaproteobacteria bacterium]|nr:pilin [Betaproteobacteria bacterium]
MNNIRSSLELCLGEGRFPLGTGANDCHIGYACSNLVVDPKHASFGTCPANAGVPQVSDPLSSTATITATFGYSAHTVLSTAGSNQLVISRNPDGTWVCSGTISNKFKPKGCA